MEGEVLATGQSGKSLHTGILLNIYSCLSCQQDPNFFDWSKYVLILFLAINCGYLTIIKGERESKKKEKAKDLQLCVVTNANQNYCSDNFVIDTNSEANMMLFISYTSIKIKKKEKEEKELEKGGEEEVEEMRKRVRKFAHPGILRTIRPQWLGYMFRFLLRILSFMLGNESDSSNANSFIA